MTGWFFSNLAWASLLMLVVLAVRRPFARLFGAGPAYALWLLPALRLVMPPLPAWGADIAALLPPQTLVVWADGRTLAERRRDRAVGASAARAWAMGAAAFLAWQLLAYRRFLTELSLTSRSLGAHRGLPLVESAAVPGPLALGLLDRRIVVPADFDTRYSPEERRLALDHECVHHRRGDIWWNHAGLVILALNWFNPIAWVAFRAFRADQELACDAAVAGSASAEARLDYARALIKSASRPGLIAACPLNHADQLKRRLKMMKDHKVSRVRMLGGAAAVALLAGVSMTFGAPGLAHPHPEGDSKSGDRVERTERVIIMNHKAGDGEHARHRVRVPHGANGEVVIPDCEGGQRTDVDENEDGERVRVVLCSRGEANPAQRAERLQRARDRLAADTELSEAQRARVTAALDRQIAQLRGQ